MMDKVVEDNVDKTEDNVKEPQIQNGMNQLRTKEKKD